MSGDSLFSLFSTARAKVAERNYTKKIDDNLFWGKVVIFTPFVMSLEDNYVHGV